PQTVFTTYANLPHPASLAFIRKHSGTHAAKVSRFTDTTHTATLRLSCAPRSCRHEKWSSGLCGCIVSGHHSVTRLRTNKMLFDSVPAMNLVGRSRAPGCTGRQILRRVPLIW